MASLKNLEKANQRVHRERGQPEARRHLGQLEKKKDYKQRAKNYSEKKSALKALHKEAEQKNPDEFYFHMVNSRMQDGIHREMDKDNVDTPEQSLLMGSNDMKYVQHMLHLENKKVERLKATLQMPDSASMPVNKRTVFVDSKKEAINYEPIRKGYAKSSINMASSSREDVHKSVKERKKMYKELLKRIERAKEMQVVVAKLKVRKDIAKTKRQKVFLEKKGTEKQAPVYRWAYERKK